MYTFRIMYLHDFTIKNYLSHKLTYIQLSPITVLVGPNAGGKSALFDAILNFSMVARGNIRQAFGPYPFSFSATRHHGALKFEAIGFEATLCQHEAAAEKLHYSIDYNQEGQVESGLPTFNISNEVLKRLPGGEIVFDRRSPGASPLKKALQHLEKDKGIFAALRTGNLEEHGSSTIEAPFERVAREISRFNRFRLNPYVLAGPSRLPDVSAEAQFPPRIGYEGEDLAACLYFLQETKNPSLEAIVEKIRCLEPQFESFDFTFLGADRIVFSVSFKDARDTIPAIKMSSGLLLYLGLMVLTYSPNRPPVLLIEEPENGLTPKAVSEFYAATRDLAQKPDESQRSQVLISSHSPFVICEAWNGHDRDFIHQVKIVNGQSVVRRFAEAIAESGAKLQSGPDGGKLGLKTAELVMSGYLS